jgi:hypothetical protein
VRAFTDLYRIELLPELVRAEECDARVWVALPSLVDKPGCQQRLLLVVESVKVGSDESVGLVTTPGESSIHLGLAFAQAGALVETGVFQMKQVGVRSVTAGSLLTFEGSCERRQ